MQSWAECAQLRDDEMDKTDNRGDTDHRCDRPPVTAQKATSPNR
jgi:hypothetical protein